MRQVATFITFLSAVVFPWPLTVCLALGIAVFEPLVPFAAGLFVDTLYYVPHGSLPYFTFGGVLVTIIAFFVRSQLKTSIIQG